MKLRLKDFKMVPASTHSIASHRLATGTAARSLYWVDYLHDGSQTGPKGYGCDRNSDWPRELLQATC